MKTILLKKEHILSLIILIFCASATNAQSESNGATSMQGFELEFNSVDGPSVTRELQLTFSENTSENFDEGYDTKNLELMQDDLNLILNGEFYTTQAYSPITEDKKVDLVFQASGSHNYTIKLGGMDNMGDRNIELKDNLLDTTFNLRSGQAYEFSSEAGYFPGRFQLTFKTTTLSQNDFDLNSIDVRYVNDINTIVVYNPTNKSVENVEMYSVSGQRVYINTISNNNNSIRYQVENLQSGIYIIRVKTEDNRLFTQKIIAK